MAGRTALAESRAVLTSRALSPVQAGATSPVWQLYVAGAPVTSSVDKVSGTYKREAGGSDMRFDAGLPLEDLEDAPVSLRVGYGDETVEYFSGRLQEPGDDPEAESGTAVVYGPFKLMASQHLNEEVRYQGVFLDHALMDLCSRAGYGRGQVEVRAGKSYRIEEVVFPEETTILEAADSLMKSAGFVGVDRPGYKRLFMPTPRPGATSRAGALYHGGNYPSGAFKIGRGSAVRYARVVVFRRREDGSYAVYARAPVENRGRYKPPRNRTYYVPEFLGSQEEAKQAAYDRARALASGLQPFELSGVALIPTLLLYDSIRVVAEEKRRSGKFRVTYDCQLDDELGFEIGREAFDMDLKGYALESSAVKLYDPIRIPSVLSPGVVVTSPLERPRPQRVTASSNEFTVDDLSAHTVDGVSV